MSPEDYKEKHPPTNPKHPDHQMPWHTESCFQASIVINCDGDRDIRYCRICGKTWTERCNFDEDYA